MTEPILSKAREEAKETKALFLTQTATLLNGAFALIAALAWNEAVKALIETYMPTASGIVSKFGYAVIITLLVVIISTRLSKIQKRYEQENNE